MKDNTPDFLSESVRFDQRAAEIEARIEERRGRERELSRLLAEAHVKGQGDDAALSSERREVRDTLSDLEAALPILRDRAKTSRWEALRSEAEKRIHEIHRSLSGNTGEQPARTRRLLEAAHRFGEEAYKVNAAFIEQRSLMAEEEALRKRFPDLAKTEPKLMPPPGRERDAEAAVAITQRVAFPIQARHLGTPSMPKDCPGALLLALAGPTEAEKREAEVREQRRKKDEEDARRLLEPLRGQIARAQVGTRVFGPT